MILAPSGRPKRAYVKRVRPSGKGGTSLENYSGIEISTPDLPALAMEIYLLLKEDMRLEQERGVNSNQLR